MKRKNVLADDGLFISKSVEEMNAIAEEINRSLEELSRAAYEGVCAERHEVVGIRIGESDRYL